MTADSQSPSDVLHFAARTVDYVKRSLGLELEYDSDTLPLLDHYLLQVPADQPAAAALAAGTAGAYFGEVVRRRLGGAWQATSGEPATWRLVLPGGLSFLPASAAVRAIVRDDSGDGDPDLQAPPKMWPHVEDALARMADVGEASYYSLSSMFDVLEHLQAVLLATAAAKAEAGGIDIESA